jgi:hypothetical protein
MILAVLVYAGIGWIAILLAGTILVLLRPNQDWLLELALAPLRILGLDGTADQVGDAVVDAADSFSYHGAPGESDE